MFNQPRLRCFQITGIAKGFNLCHQVIHHSGCFEYRSVHRKAEIDCLSSAHSVFCLYVCADMGCRRSDQILRLFQGITETFTLQCFNAKYKHVSSSRFTRLLARYD